MPVPSARILSENVPCGFSSTLDVRHARVAAITADGPMFSRTARSRASCRAGSAGPRSSQRCSSVSRTASSAGCPRSLLFFARGQSVWQASSKPVSLIWETGPDASFWLSCAAALVVGAAAVWAYRPSQRSHDRGRAVMVCAHDHQAESCRLRKNAHLTVKATVPRTDNPNTGNARSAARSSISATCSHSSIPTIAANPPTNNRMGRNAQPAYRDAPWSLVIVPLLRRLIRLRQAQTCIPTQPIK